MIWKILTVILAVSVAVLIAVLVKIRAQLRDINEQLDFYAKGYKYAPFNRYQHG